ncbi:MAG: hypothetical protein LCH90_01745, partial [Proteobacteria bacterium]|nr:hypothetical protein [Pseudomonadota bacterium]
GVTTYSERPCGEKPKTVELNVHQPDARERALARQRAAVDRRDAAVVDYEQARLESERRVERSQRASAEASHNAKCAGYERGARNAVAEREMYRTQPFRDDADRRRKEYEAAHFSECYAK